MLIYHPLWHIFSKKRVIKLNTLKKPGLRDAKDALIWDYAIKNGTVIITKDEDFEERLSHRPKMVPAVVWIRLGNTTKGALLLWFNNILPEIIHRLEAGEKLIEVI